MTEHTRVLVAYALAAAGVLVSFAAAVQPHYDAAYRLHADLLIWGLIPYVVFIGVSGILHRATLVLPIVLLLASDVTLRAVHSGFPEWVQSAPGHAGILTLIVLPLGILIGKGMSRPLPEEEPEFVEAPPAEEAYEKEKEQQKEQAEKKPQPAQPAPKEATAAEEAPAPKQEPAAETQPAQKEPPEQKEPSAQEEQAAQEESAGEKESPEHEEQKQQAEDEKKK